MKSNTAAACVPQSRKSSASLRRLAARRATHALAVSALFAWGAASAQAQTNYTTTTGGTFSTAFTPTIPAGGTSSASGDGLTFNGTTYTATDDLTSTQPLNLNFLTFGNSGLVTVARGGGSNLVTLGATTGGTNPTVNLNNTGGLTFALDVALAANTSFAGTGNATFSGLISGTGGLTQNGTGTLTLSNFNTYSGGTTVNAGTLALAAGGGSGAVRGVVNVSSGATLSLNVNNALGYNAGSQVATVNINGGTVSVNGNQGDEGFLTSFNLTGGTLAYASTNGSAYQIAAGDTTAPGISSSASGTTSLISGGLNIRSGNLGFTVASGTTASGIDLLVSGAVTASGTYGLTKTGAGLMALTNANTYTGVTTISAGTLQLGNGTTGSDGTIAGASIVNNSALIYNIAGSTTYGGVISGSGTVAKTGAGTQTLSGNSTYTGATVINGGTLTLTGGGNSGGALSGTPTITINNGGTLNLTNGDTLGYTSGVEALIINSGGTVQNNTSGKRDTLQNTVTMTGGTLTGTGGDGSGAYSFDNANAVNATSDANGVAALINAGQVSLQAGNETFTVTRGTKTPASDLTISSIISNFGTYGLIKAGNGILTLSGANTYNGGTTVNAGILNLANSLALQNSTLTTVSSGTTFDSSVASHAFTLGGLSDTGSPAGNLALQDNAASPNAVALSVGNNNASTTYNGVLSGAGSVIKIGTGTLTFNGTNTYTGATVVNGGTLMLASNGGSSLGGLAGTPTITVNNGGTVNLTNGDTLGFTAGHEALVINSGGQVLNNGTGTRDTLQNTVIMTGGILGGSSAGNGNGAYSFNTANAVTATSDANGVAALINAKQVSLQVANATLNVTRGTATPASDLTISSIISNYGSGTDGITKTGSGILTLTGTNTYTGGTTVNNGTLVAASNTALGTGALTFTPAPGSTATVTFTSANPSVSSITGTSTGASAIVLGNTTANTPTVLTFGSDNTSTTYNGTISDGSPTNPTTINATGSLVKTGTGTQTFSNTAINTYRGGTTVSSGTLSGNATSYGSGAVTVASGATADYTQSATTGTATNNISGQGTASFGGNATSANGTGGTINYTGNDSAAQTNVQSGTVTLNRTGGPAISGPVAVATGATLQLNADTQVAASAPPTSPPATTAVTLTGGTFNGNGHSDGTVADPTHLATTSVTTSMGALSLGSSSATTSILDFGAAQGTGPFVLAFADSSGTLGSGLLNVIDYTGGTDALYIGNSASLTPTQLAQISFGGVFDATQLANGEIAAAPEPSAWAAFGIGLLGLGGLALRAKQRRHAGQPA